MRLTLRTMLAYLDDILEPSDATELGSKIQESKFATDLVHRIRNSTRRLRLGAPKLDGKGMGLDANTVAEYLDNTLPSDQVPGFEKVCLESDVHLAEVASCHQILTIVLGEPAEISDAVRDRMYRIGNGEEAAVAAPPVPAEDPLQDISAEDMQGPARVAPVKVATDPVPDYMQSNRISLKSLAITLIFAFVLAVVALRALGPFNRKHLVARLLLGAPVTEVAESNSSETPAQPLAETTGPAAPTEEQPTTAAPDVSEETAPDSTASPVTPSPPANPVQPPESQDGQPDTVRPPSVTVGGDGSLVGGDGPPETPGVATAPPGLPAIGGDETPAEPSIPVAEPDEPPPAVGVETVVSSNVGRYISEEQVLGRLDTESGSWMRVTPDSSLMNGDRLVTFPTYRPVLVLAGIKTTLSDETSIEVRAADATGFPQLVMRYGRATIVPVGDANARMVLKMQNREATIMFANLDSAAAIEVRRYLPPGSDPESTNALVVVQVYATSGQIGWQEGDDAPVGVDAGRVLVCVDEGPVSVVDAGQIPNWVDGGHIADIERRASRELRKYLSADRPLSLSLMERTDFRQQEVVALASRSLCCLDVYDPIIEALGKKYQHSYWDAHFESLQTAVARSPESAAALRRVAEKQFGEDAPILYRLIWGFSQDQLATGGADDLVVFLEHNSMPIRVLAYENLYRITGMTQLFRPELPPEQEKQKVKWRKALQEGRITYQELPTPFPPRPDVPPPASE